MTARKPNLPPTFKSQILELHARSPHLNTWQIANIVGCSLNRVRDIRVACGLPIPPMPHRREVGRWKITFRPTIEGMLSAPG